MHGTVCSFAICVGLAWTSWTVPQLLVRFLTSHSVWTVPSTNHFMDTMLFTKRNLARSAIDTRMLYEFFVGLFVAMRLLWVLLLAIEQCHIPWSVPFTLFWSLYYCNDQDKQVLVRHYGRQNGGFETARRPRTKDAYPSWTPDLVK